MYDEELPAVEIERLRVRRNWFDWTCFVLCCIVVAVAAMRLYGGCT